MNILKVIVTKYPDAWKMPKKFKALLADYLPEDELTRTLLIISVEKKIPNDLLCLSVVNHFMITNLAKRLVASCGCSNALAKEIVETWIDALDLKIEEDNWMLEEYIECMWDHPKIRYVLRHHNVFTLSDLSRISESEYAQMKSGEQGLIKRLCHKYNIQLLTDEEKKELNTTKEYELMLAHEAFLSNEHNELVIHLENAVRLGYKGDFSILPYLYLTGKCKTCRSIKKGYNWLLRLWNDYSHRLKISSSEKYEFKASELFEEPVFTFAYLVVLLLNTIDDQNAFSISFLDRVIVESIWEDAFRKAETRDSGDHILGEKLLSLFEGINACCINSKFLKDIMKERKLQWCLFKSCIAADAFGSDNAGDILAKEVLGGTLWKITLLDVDQNKVIDCITKSAANGKEVPLQFCKEFFFTSLSWDRFKDWSKVDVYYLLSGLGFEPAVVSVFQSLGINTLEEYRKFTNIYELLLAFKKQGFEKPQNVLTVIKDSVETDYDENQLLNIELFIADKNWELSRSRDAVLHMEKAYELGFQGYYLFVSEEYINSGCNAAPDLPKGFKWMKKLFEEAKSGMHDYSDDSDELLCWSSKLDTGIPCLSCSLLGIQLINALDESSVSDNEKEAMADYVLNMFKYTIDYLHQSTLNLQDSYLDDLKKYYLEIGFYFLEKSLKKGVAESREIEYARKAFDLLNNGNGTRTDLLQGDDPEVPFIKCSLFGMELYGKYKFWPMTNYFWKVSKHIWGFLHDNEVIDLETFEKLQNSFKLLGID